MVSKAREAGTFLLGEGARVVNDFAVDLDERFFRE